MTALARIDWLFGAALLGGAVALVVVILGGDRAFWYDEVFTLGAASAGPGPDWAAISRDVHPPTYVLLVSLLGQVVGPDSAWLRLVNLPGLAVLVWAAALQWRVLGRDRSLVWIALISCNLYVLNLGLDLRSYALLAAFAALGQAALVREFLDEGSRPFPLIVAATALTALHFFGAALGLSLLAISCWHWLRVGRLRQVGIRVLAGSLLLGGFLAWVFGSDALQATGGKLWITNSIGPWLDFAAWQVPLVLTLFVLLAYVRSTGAAAAYPSAAAWTLAPGAMVVVAALAISLHTPVISARNLVVLVPGVVLATTLALPDGLLARLRVTPMVLIPLMAFGLRYGDTAIRDAQMIRWATEAANQPDCAGAPLLMEKPGVVERYAQIVFLGEVQRPPVDFTAPDFTTAPLPQGCAILGAGWHKAGGTQEVAAHFAARGQEVAIVPPSDARLAASGLRTHGYLIVLP